MDDTRKGASREEFIETYNRYYALVYSTIFTRVGNTDDAGDLSQEVFIRYYENMEIVENPRKWLYGTLRNVTLDFFKKKRPEEPAESMDDMGVTFANGFRDTRIMIEEALEHTDNFTDESELVLFRLIAVYNFSYREAGSHAGMSERQAKYRYGLIVKRLAEYFQRKGIRSIEDLL